jgi:hypothetical protein
LALKREAMTKQGKRKHSVGKAWHLLFEESEGT